MNRKGNIFAYLGIWIVVTLLLTVLLKAFVPCIHVGLAFVGMLLLSALVIFGISTGNLAVGTITTVSGTAIAVFLILSLVNCITLPI